MRTHNEINQMFKDMDLDTEEKRAKFIYSFVCSSDKNYEALPFFRGDTKTKELRGEKDAELE